jgi:leucyl-tRNA synthetase
MREYNHQEIENKWQTKWKENKTFKTKTEGTRENDNNEFILVEFPYPSGDLHVGHWYAFAVSDIYARYRKMLGKNVLFPIGFDAFGLPAENAAIKHNVNPKDWTYSNIERMERQLESMGAIFDWDNKVITSDKEYYKWTQWLFIQLFNAGLAYQKVGRVNWCPSCKTVLANEQVVSGKCDRCESEITQKEMKEWKLKITDYAERLIDDLDKVNWPNHIKQSQINWIGKSTGTKFKFETRSTKSQTNPKLEITKDETRVEVFTTRADTFFGITYLVLAPENKLVDELKDDIKNWEQVDKYRKETKTKTELQRISEVKEKTGAKLEGITAIHPGTNRELPIFISDYVIASYGTGAVMAVPAHDDRDYEFAKKFEIEVIEVIKSISLDSNINEKAYTQEGVLINSDKFNGLSSKEAIDKITTEFGEKTTTFKMRDWSVSRQRYWGCPIPIIHCEKCGAVPELDQNLPVELPYLKDYTPNDDGQSPLAKAFDWGDAICPKCSSKAKRDTDTLDTFVDSSWYFLRYFDNKNENEFSSKEKQQQWMPVDFYSGGIEHTTMHLLYSRFFQKALFDLGLVLFDEPFTKRNNRGIILGTDGNKMSKSKGNVINPDEYVDKVGSDTVRGYLAFMGPYNEAGSYPWDPNGVVGIRRFIERVFGLQDKISDIDSSETIKLLHKTIKGVGEDYQSLKFNTALSKLMILANLMEKEKFSKETYKTFTQIFSPIAPHVCEEIWNLIGETNFVSISKWPNYDPEKIIDENLELSIQINGKFRFRTSIPKELSEEEIKEIVQNLPQTQKWLLDKHPKKIIYIQGKIMNIIADL